MLASTALVLSRSFELSLLAKATAVLTLTLFAVLALPRARASRRHVVLAASFAMLAALPLVGILAPPVLLTIATESRAPSVMPAPTPTAPIATVESGPPASSLDTTATAALPGTWSPPSAVAVLRVVWAVGLALCLVPVFSTIRHVRRLRSASKQWPEGTERARRLAEGARLRRTVTVRLHEDATAPMTFGFAQPAIVLPMDASSWTERDLERALVHELEHVRRGDWPLQIFARIVCACYWCHPLVWIAWRRLHVEADRACDDAVAALGESEAFARQLVSMARTMSARPSSMVPSMARRSGLSTRVAALLNVRQARGPAGPAWMLATVALTWSCSVMLAPLRAVGTERSVPAERRLETPPPARAIAPSASPSARVADQPPSKTAVPAKPSSPAPIVAQAPPPPKTAVPSDLRFELVSVTRSAPGISFGSPSSGGSTFIAYGMSLASLVAWAHGIGGGNALRPGGTRPWATLDDSPVRGEPVMSDRFDIRGKAPFESPDPAPGALGVFHYLMQGLLADRFGVVTHWESRPRSIYILHTVGEDLKLGPNIRRSVLDCEALKRGDPPPNTVRTAGGPSWRPACGTSASTGFDSPFMPSRFVGTISAGSISMATLAERLSSAFRAEVVDATALRDQFDVELRVGIGAQSPNDALREQLGLWLEEQKAPGDVLVIDKVRTPALD
jgi:uncharacterized protein (TIGR03435 family)